jgi:cellulose synthase/poly-beta-1,6-N-acetylglucosamine synthase-like glycosyltransferase
MADGDPQQPSAPERAARDPHATYALVSSIVFLVTAVLVMIGLSVVMFTTHTLWVQALLLLLVALWVLTVVQNVRLALVSLIGFLLRRGLLPTDFLLTPFVIQANAIPANEIEENELSANDLISTRTPRMPSLSVLIPAVNEDEALIRRGISSVRATRYNGLLRIYLLDDSKDGKYKALAAETGIEYVARPVKDHGKAGNLNYTLKNYVHTELFFVMDCDYEIVDPDIFVKMVAVMDERTALVQAPQRYINVSDSKASMFAEVENVIWFDIINLHADRYDIVPYHGTNSIVRTEALREVDYLDEDSAVDDFPTYARMVLRGWKTAYLPDVVMEGSAPKDLQGLLKQRKKWAMGMGKSFISVGYKLLGKRSFVESVHHWCNFTWFAWPVTNMAYSFLLGIFVYLQYLGIFTIPMLPLLVLLHLIASVSLLILLGGRRFGVAFVKMLSMDFLLTYEFGYNYIRGILGARTDVLTPKRSSGLGPAQLLRMTLPILGTIIFFTYVTYISILIQQAFYAAFGIYNVAMYAYSLTNLKSNPEPASKEEREQAPQLTTAVYSLSEEA